ncbi:MAG: hypothetical protein ACYTBJ_19105 [Planctomycetota bacterium]
MTKSALPQSPRDSERAWSVYTALRRTRPADKRDLKNYVKAFLGIDVPDRRICPEHGSPMDYLWHSFRADFTAEACRRKDKTRCRRHPAGLPL